MTNFLEYFEERTGIIIKYVDRHTSVFMRFCHYGIKVLSFILRLLNRRELAKGDFLENYVTTIGRTIYAHPIWNSKTTPPSRVVVHELTHILQYQRYGWKYCLGYLFSKRKRLYYESEAFQTECLCFPGLLENENIFTQRVKALSAYGINPYRSRLELEARRQEIKGHMPRICALLLHQLWIRWHDDEKEKEE